MGRGETGRLAEHGIFGKEIRRGQLTLTSNADIMSDMKTFTVRDLDREPSAVLDAADRDGAVRIRRRDGRTYSVRPEGAESAKIAVLPDLDKRRKAIFSKGIPASQVRKVDKLIAGE